ncbi:hypothetical protein MM26B8_01910 [Mycoplasmopsis meleagridis]|uniref:Lipoprotein-associated type-17 domain-containing protein n=1 Tax=Mycoplasmopsis meleagridis ATCC 25294 TaxID=1264554 RepID=A0A0F5H183_9BACT|nr:lipoprotein 17-related variable surface protein [Mycoplasmopsis meleagridis]KKB26973.1 hypothetical protein MMELEA_04270 [Mycoplasmopsis meleagridis ATCC 25294]OAD18562.1 hypothetical protein MM26B8_01910 [Mycoplasmopsis meleagridis]VEU77569.1 Uncharacterised protein [Mycoplasmopsis meleagridis]
MVLEFSDFDSWNKRKIKKLAELNKLLNDHSVSKDFSLKEGEKSQLKASQITKEKLIASLNPQQENTSIIIQNVNANDDTGTLQITYKLHYKNTHFEVNSDNNLFNLEGFKTNEGKHSEQIQAEYKRISSQDFTITYPSLEQTYAIDAKSNFFTIESGENVKLINPKIISFDNEKGSVTLQYQLQSTKNGFDNLVSQNKEKTISGFKKGLSIDALINKEQSAIDRVAISFNYPNKENVLVKDAKLSEITNSNLESKYKLDSLRNLVANDLNDSISFEYRLINENFYGKTVYSSWRSQIINGFKNIIKAKAETDISEFLTKHQPSLETKLKNHPNLKLFSISITPQNASLYLNLDNNKNIDVKVKDLKIDNKDINTLNYTLEASRDGVTKNKTESLKFTNDATELIGDMKYSSLDDLYDINYTLLNQLAGYDLTDPKNASLFNLIFKKKMSKIKGILDYEIDKRSIVNKVELENKSYTVFDENNFKNSSTYTAKVYKINLSANVNLKIGDNIIRELKNVSTNVNNHSSDLSNKNNVMAFFDTTDKKLTNNHITYSFSQEFLKKYQPKNYKLDFGKKTDRAEQIDKNIEDALKEVATEIKATEGDKYKTVNVDQIGNSSDSTSKALLLETIKKILTFKSNGWTISEVLPIGKDFTEEKYKNNPPLYSVINIGYDFWIYLYLKLTKNNQSIELPVVLTNVYYGNDAKDLEIVNLVLNNNIKDIILMSKYKNKSLQEANVLASDAFEKLNELYEFPKSGEYEIKVLPEKDTEAFGLKYDNVSGYANVNFGLYKNGVYTGIKTLGIKWQGFKPFTKQDIKPKNGNSYTQEDFQPIKSKTKLLTGIEIDKDNSLGNDRNLKHWKDKIDKINSTNFTYRFSQGNEMNNTNTRRTIDADLIIKQKAYDNLDKVLIFNSTGRKDTNKYNDISPDTDKDTNINVSDLSKDFFIYFYDINGGYDAKNNNKGWLSFKLGFINKKNPNMRYTNNKTIKVVNLENDFKLDAYPTALVNNLTFDDLDIKQDQIKQVTISQFQNEIKTPANSKKYLALKDSANYHGFKFSNKDNLQIKEVKVINDKSGGQKVFIRLKYVNFVGFLDKTKNIDGDIWYELSGFKDQKTASSLTDDQILDNLSATYYMKKVFLTNGNVLRRRKIEFNYKDILFKISDDQRSVTWLFKNDYFMPLLGNNKNNQNAKINFHFNTNLLNIDNDRFIRIVTQDKGLNISLDWEKLNKEKKITINKETDEVNGIKATFEVIFELTKDGISFTYKLTDNKNYKIIGDNFATNTYYGKDGVYKNTLPNPAFDPNKAVFFSKNLGATVNIQYLNNVKNETFSSYKTNVFDYNHLAVTSSGMPFYVYNEGYNHGEMFKYNPNQALPYKWHEGYKLDIDFGFLSYQDKRWKNAVNRAVIFNQGTGLILGKVNKDPNDGRFYIVSNHHVINNDSFMDKPYEGKVKETKITHAGLNRGITVGTGFNFNDNTEKTNIFTIWGGQNQIPNVGEGKAQSVDLSVSIIDINDLIKKFREAGRMQSARWYENLKEIPNLVVNDYNKDNFQFVLAAINRQNSKSWEGKPAFTVDRMLTSFPGLQQVGFIVNRTKTADNREFVGRNSWNTQLNYTPSLTKAGESGTGLIDKDGNYMSSINSGGNYSQATAWQYYWNAYDTNSNKTTIYDYFGLVNKNAKEILDQKNLNSLSLNILKMAAFDPTIDIPYWLSDPKHIE